jgi:hypothetical protein
LRRVEADALVEQGIGAIAMVCNEREVAGAAEDISIF